jgi:hypothetical protein
VYRGSTSRAKANIIHDRKLLIIKGNEFHYLGILMDFAFEWSR